MIIAMSKWRSVSFSRIFIASSNYSSNVSNNIFAQNPKFQRFDKMKLSASMISSLEKPCWKRASEAVIYYVKRLQI
jgi:hypothetical protein